MAKKSSISRKAVDQVLITAGIIVTLVLLTVGGLAWWASSFINTQVHDQLAAQKVYFPPADKLPAAEYGNLDRYAGQLVDNGAKAKAYADEYIKVHLENIAGGKTYSEVSSEAMQNPSDQALQGKKAALFQGETLRGLLLGNGYAFGTIGQIAQIAAVVSIVAGAAMLVLVLLGFRHLKSIS